MAAGERRGDYRTRLPSVADRVEADFETRHLAAWQRICQPEQTFYDKQVFCMRRARMHACRQEAIDGFRRQRALCRSLPRAGGGCAPWCTPSRACCVLRHPPPPLLILRRHQLFAVLRSCRLEQRVVLSWHSASCSLLAATRPCYVFLPLPLVELSGFTSPNPVPISPPLALPHPPCTRSAHARHCQKETCARTSDT